MKHFLAGGPLLGEKSPIEWGDKDGEAVYKKSVKSNVPSSYTFQPLITPLIGVPSQNFTGNASNVTPERFILLPHGRYIQVLAFQTGKSIAHLMPFESTGAP